jgi:hypothetical protein
MARGVLIWNVFAVIGVSEIKGANGVL